MAKFNFDEEKLVSVLEKLQGAKDTLSNLESGMTSGLSLIQSARGSAYLDTGDLQEGLALPDTCTTEINAMILSLQEKAEAILKYNDEVSKMGFGSRLLGTLGMFTSKVVEGVFTAGEQLVDGFASIIGWVGGLFGAKKFKEKVGEFVKKDHVGDAFHKFYYNTGIGQAMTKASYFSESGGFAKFTKGVGTAVGYAAAIYFTGGAAGAVSGAGFAAGASAASSSLAVAATAAGVGALGGTMQAGLQIGMDYDDAFKVGVRNGLISAATVVVLNKAIGAVVGKIKAHKAAKTGTDLVPSNGTPGGGTGTGATGGPTGGGPTGGPTAGGSGGAGAGGATAGSTGSYNVAGRTAQELGDKMDDIFAQLNSGKITPEQAVQQATDISTQIRKIFGSNSAEAAAIKTTYRALTKQCSAVFNNTGGSGATAAASNTAGNAGANPGVINLGAGGTNTAGQTIANTVAGTGDDLATQAIANTAGNAGATGTPSVIQLGPGSAAQGGATTTALTVANQFSDDGVNLVANAATSGSNTAGQVATQIKGSPNYINAVANHGADVGANTTTALVPISNGQGATTALATYDPAISNLFTNTVTQGETKLPAVIAVESTSNLPAVIGSTSSNLPAVVSGSSSNLPAVIDNTALIPTTPQLPAVIDNTALIPTTPQLPAVVDPPVIPTTPQVPAVVDPSPKPPIVPPTGGPPVIPADPIPPVNPPVSKSPVIPIPPYTNPGTVAPPTLAPFTTTPIQPVPTTPTTVPTAPTTVPTGAPPTSGGGGYIPPTNPTTPGTNPTSPATTTPATTTPPTTQPATTTPATTTPPTTQPRTIPSSVVPEYVPIPDTMVGKKEKSINDYALPAAVGAAAGVAGIATMAASHKKKYNAEYLDKKKDDDEDDDDEANDYKDDYFDSKERV